MAECRTPRDVCRTVQRHIAYREEGDDTWSEARATWQREYGDCEDFAVLIQAMCAQLGFESTVQLFYPGTIGAAGHAVLIGTHEGRTWLASNGSYEEVESIGQVRERVAHTLWCDPSRIWSIVLAQEDVERRLQGQRASTPTAAGIQTSALDR